MDGEPLRDGVRRVQDPELPLARVAAGWLTGEGVRNGVGAHHSAHRRRLEAIPYERRLDLRAGEQGQSFGGAIDRKEGHADRSESLNLNVLPLGTSIATYATSRPKIATYASCRPK